MTQLDFEITCYNARGIADKEKRKRFSVTYKRNLPQRPLFLFRNHTLIKTVKSYGAISREGKCILIMAPKAAVVSQ